MSGASLARWRIDQRVRWLWFASGVGVCRRGLLPALAVLALETELIAKPARSSTGVPAAATYRQ